VNDILRSVNCDKMLCGSFGLYPSYAHGILNCVNEINFYVLWSEKLNYADYVENVLQVKYSVTYKPHRLDEFLLSCSIETIALFFIARQCPELPSELIFAQSIMNKIGLLSPAFGIVCINKRVSYITN